MRGWGDQERLIKENLRGRTDVINTSTPRNGLRNCSIHIPTNLCCPARKTHLETVRRTNQPSIKTNLHSPSRGRCTPFPYRYISRILAWTRDIRPTLTLQNSSLDQRQPPTSLTRDTRHFDFPRPETPAQHFFCRRETMIRGSLHLLVLCYPTLPRARTIYRIRSIYRPYLARGRYINQSTNKRTKGDNNLPISSVFHNLNPNKRGRYTLPRNVDVCND